MLRTASRRVLGAVALATAAALVPGHARGLETTPALPLPPVDLPALPTPPLLPELPSLPGVPSAPSLPSAPPGAPAVPGAPSVSGPAGTPAAPGAGARGSAPGGGASGSGTGSQEARPSQRSPRARYEQRLRRTVSRYRGCLAAVDPDSRRVLKLRAGIDGRPLSRGETARRLDTSTRQVARLERRGLRRLQTLGRGGACRGGSGGGGAPAAQLGLTGLPAFRPTALLARPLIAELASARSVDRQEVAGETESSGDKAETGGGRGGDFPASGRSLARDADEGGLPEYLPFLLALIALTALATLLVMRRREAAAPSPAGGPEAPDTWQPITPAAAVAPPLPRREPERARDETPLGTPVADETRLREALLGQALAARAQTPLSTSVPDETKPRDVVPDAGETRPGAMPPPAPITRRTASTASRRPQPPSRPSAVTRVVQRFLRPRGGWRL
jgi:hypothetical protein